MTNLPGGAIAKRPLHFAFVIDTSASMLDYGKIQALNNAIREIIPHMQKVAEDNPYADILIRVLKFSNGAEWIINPPTPISEFKWINLDANGETHMGRAFELLADALKIPPMSERGLPPVIVLVTDGMPTDDYNKGLKHLLEQFWGQRAIKIAIAIGDGDQVDLNVMQKFIGNNEIKPLLAKNAEQLVNYIKWSSTAVLKHASSPPSKIANKNSGDQIPPLSTNVDSLGDGSQVPPW